MTEDFTILLVENSPMMRRLVREMLRVAGNFRVIEAAQGHDALAQLEALRVDMVISDWSMHPVNGMDLLRTMRADPRFATIPFVMMTGEQTPTFIADAVAAGVNAYLTKPFDRKQLTRVVQQCLAGRLNAA